MKIKNLLNVGIFFCSILIGTVVYINGNKQLELNSQKSFVYDSINSENTINNNIDKYNKIILSINAMLVSNSDISLDHFNSTIESLNLTKFYPAFKSFIYVSYKNNKGLSLSKSINNKLIDDLDSYVQIHKNLSIKEISDIKNRYNSISNNDLYIVRLVSPVERNFNFLGLSFNNYNEIKEVLSKEKENETKIIPVIKNGEYIGFLNIIIDKNLIISDSLSTNKNIKYKIKNNDNYINLLNNIENKFIYEMNLVNTKNEDSIYLYTENGNVYISKLNYLFLCIISLLTVLIIYYLLIIITNNINDFLLNIIKNKGDIKLEKLAWNDSLTGLFNRAYFLNSIEKKIKTEKNNKFTLFFIDLDGFKKVNDTLGHHAGDLVLKNYAERLQLNLSDDVNQIEIARVGGDEFVIYMNGITNIENMIVKIKKATNTVFDIENHKFLLSQSIGISFYPETGVDVETLLRKADMAMYISKKSDSYDYVIYSEKVGQEMVERNKMENNLRDSIDSSELYLLYQPKIIIDKNGKKDLSGFEALMRWNSPVWGEVGPDKFIPIAEQNGFIDDMTKWLVAESCKTITYFEILLKKKFTISVNLSGRQFNNFNLAKEFLEIINKSGIDKSSILFEITESTIMAQPENAELIIKYYRENGIKIALDDFGTGYSSFSYLSKYTVDEIKIDKCFIDNIINNESDKALVEAIILMAHRLKLKVVCEGIENVEQFNYLNQVGCDIYQGFYFSRPLYSHQINKFYKSLI